MRDEIWRLDRMSTYAANELAGRGDIVGARQILEQFVLPVVVRSKLIKHLVPTRAQLAVLIAWDGQVEEAQFTATVVDGQEREVSECRSSVMSRLLELHLDAGEASQRLNRLGAGSFKLAPPVECSTQLAEHGGQLGAKLGAADHLVGPVYDLAVK